MIIEPFVPQRKTINMYFTCFVSQRVRKSEKGKPVKGGIATTMGSTWPKF